MLISKEVEIVLHGMNISHFQKLGYNIPEKYDKKHKKFVVPKNTKIIVKTEDLMPQCHVLVKILCDYCLEEGKKTLLGRNYNDYINLNQRGIIHKDCCKKCEGKKLEESLLLTYGVKNPTQLPEVINKIKNTNLEKYGETNYCKTEDYKENVRKTNLKKYGVEHPIQNEQIKEKFNKTILEKYNVKNVSQLEEIKQKKIQTSLIHFNKEYTMQDEGVKLKFRETCLKKFGVENPNQSEEIKLKKKKTFILHYGIDNYAKTKEFKLKVSGQNNHNWKGGVTLKYYQIRQSNEYKEWRKKVFERDNYTCQICGDNKGGNLSAHHIENFSSNEELRFDISNGITVCDNCHNPNKKNSFHNIYGTRNNTRQQFEEYIQRYKNGEFND